MKLYTVIIVTDSISGDSHFNISDIYDSKEKAQEIVDEFNELNLCSHAF